MSPQLALIDVFRANLSRSIPSGAGVAFSEELLAGPYKRGRRAWPHILLSCEAFVIHLARHCAQDEYVADFFPSAPIEKLCLTCVRGRPPDLAAFDELRLDRIPSFVNKGTARPGEASLDNVRVTLSGKRLVSQIGSLPKSSEYAGRGTQPGCVRAAAMRTAVSLRRNLGDALNIEKFGGMLGVHHMTVSLEIVVARAAVLERMRSYLRGRLRLSLAQMESLARLLQSQLHVSIARLLTAEEPLSG